MQFSKKQILVYLMLFAVIAFVRPAGAQTPNLAHHVLEEYSQFKEVTLDKRRINHQDIKPLIEELKKEPGFTVQKVGESIEERDLHLISIGDGDIDVFLWSQMHGDESTATMAIFDIFNFLKSDLFIAEKQELLKNVKLHFLPMLNPDGAEDFQRRNALGVDVNRDALRLQSPEAKTLKRVRDSLEADFGFNLHDQSKYYNAENTGNPATISFLAPAYNYEKTINDTRGDAMRLIVGMNKELQKVMPGQVARYNDDFEPRAFGDNIQKWGTSTILIESGGFLNDPEKQEIRKFNFLAILSAVLSISEGDYKNEDIEEYEQIPENDSKLFDVLLKGVEYELNGKNYILDIGINHAEVPSSRESGYFIQSRVAELGDLSTHYGYNTYDLTNHKTIPGKIYPKTLESEKDLEGVDFPDLLSKGYSYIKIRNFPSRQKAIDYPVILVKDNYEVPDRVYIGMNPTFFLERDGKIIYAVINGFVQPVENWKNSVENGLILR